MVNLEWYSALAALNTRLRGELPQIVYEYKKTVESVRVCLEDSRRQTQMLENAFREAKSVLDDLEGEYIRALMATFKEHGLNPDDVDQFLDELARKDIPPELVNIQYVNNLQPRRMLLPE